jgi:signal recognition particle subunit SRP72
LKTKLFLLLQTERYNEALSLLNEDALREQGAEESYGFEKAYTLYRLQKEQQAKDFLDALPEKENHRGIIHLEAQLVRPTFRLYTLPHSHRVLYHRTIEKGPTK